MRNSTSLRRNRANLERTSGANPCVATVALAPPEADTNLLTTHSKLWAACFTCSRCRFSKSRFGRHFFGAAKFLLNSLLPLSSGGAKDEKNCTTESTAPNNFQVKEQSCGSSCICWTWWTCAQKS